jgi:hypothetical protein
LLAVRPLDDWNDIPDDLRQMILKALAPKGYHPICQREKRSYFFPVSRKAAVTADKVAGLSLTQAMDNPPRRFRGIACAAWASWQHAGDCDDNSAVEGGDRVGGRRCGWSICGSVGT